MNKPNLCRCIYLFFSILSGFIELGIPIIAIHEFELVWLALASSIFYHTACFIAKYVTPSWMLTTQTTAAGAILMLIFVDNKSPLFFGFAAAFIPLGLHYVRLKSKLQASKTSTAIKRLARIVGFCIAGVASPTFMAVAGIICFIACIMLRNFKEYHRVDLKYIRNKTKTILPITMFVHQIHYFTYCYPLLYTIICRFEYNYRYAAPAFSLGWVSYILSEKIFKQFELTKTLIFGHFFVFISLLPLYISKNIDISCLLFLWFLTGFGGGTVFCIRTSNRQLPIQLQSDLDIWEDLGHIAGSIIGAIIIIVTNKIENTYLLAGITAIMTSALYAIHMTRIPKYKSIPLNTF